MGRRGALIVLEGLDHSGKTTQAKLLVSSLRSRGRPVADEAWRFPSRQTPIGKMIGAYLTNAAAMDDRALHLLFSANRWECSAKLREELEAGRTVIVDRYAYSGVAYTAAKGYDLQWCKRCDEGLPSPDVVLFLVVPPGVASTRGTFGSERYETLPVQRRVKDVYHKLSGGSRWHSIDAVGTVDEVQRRCLRVVEKILGEMDSDENAKPLGVLWDGEE